MTPNFITEFYILQRSAAAPTTGRVARNLGTTLSARPTDVSSEDNSNKDRDLPVGFMADKYIVRDVLMLINGALDNLSAAWTNVPNDQVNVTLLPMKPPRAVSI